MATGDHDWTAGEQVTAANMDDYLQLQVVQQFATAAARDTALSARKREGMVTYQIDTNTLTVYTGAAWSTIGPVHGAWTSYAPVVTQSGAVTHTDNYCKYMRVGRYVTGNLYITCTGNGTAANTVTVSLPVAAASNFLTVGMGRIFDSSATVIHSGAAVLTSTTTLGFMVPTTVAPPGFLGVSQFTAALASPDEIYAVFSYEAAADA